jgi:hypothetical protein
MHGGSGDRIEWYSKQGGDNTSIDVMIHLKDRKGVIVHKHPDLPIFTDLVYEDGSALVMHRLTAEGRKKKLSLKSKEVTQEQETRISKTRGKRNQIVYRPMRPEPILFNGNGSVHFAFRIEDVSVNHKPHVGFKLKVCCGPMMADGTRVYGGLMDETIVVKSRPSVTTKSGPLQDRTVGGRTTILQKVLGGIPILGNITSKLARSPLKKEKSDPKEAQLNVSTTSAVRENIPPATGAVPLPTLLSTNKTKKYIQVDSKTQKVSFDMECINSFFCGIGNSCISCGEILPIGECLSPAEHKLDCRLFLTLSPLLIHSLSDFGNSSVLCKDEDE